MKSQKGTKKALKKNTGKSAASVNPIEASTSPGEFRVSRREAVHSNGVPKRIKLSNSSKLDIPQYVIAAAADANMRLRWISVRDGRNFLALDAEWMTVTDEDGNTFTRAKGEKPVILMCQPMAHYLEDKAEKRAKHQALLAGKPQVVQDGANMDDYSPKDVKTTVSSSMVRP